MMIIMWDEITGCAKVCRRQKGYDVTCYEMRREEMYVGQWNSGNTQKLTESFVTPSCMATPSSHPLLSFSIISLMCSLLLDLRLFILNDAVVFIIMNHSDSPRLCLCLVSTALNCVFCFRLEEISLCHNVCAALSKQTSSG